MSPLTTLWKTDESQQAAKSVTDTDPYETPTSSTIPLIAQFPATYNKDNLIQPHLSIWTQLLIL